MIIRILLFIISVVMIVKTSGKFRGRNVRYYENIFWLLVWAFLGVVAIVPEITSYLATWVGVGRGADLVIYASTIALFYMLFKIFVRLEKMERDMTKIVRKIAIEYIDEDSSKHGDKRDSNDFADFSEKKK